jgi:hypothetical protein
MPVHARTKTAMTPTRRMADLRLCGLRSDVVDIVKNQEPGVPCA